MAILLSSWALLGARDAEVSASEPRRRLRLLALVPVVSGPGTTCTGLVEAPTEEEEAAAAAVGTDRDTDTCTKDARRRPVRHRRRFRVVMVHVQFYNNVGDIGSSYVANSNAVVACHLWGALSSVDERSLLMIVLGGKFRFRCSGMADCAKIWATPKICCLHAVLSVHPAQDFEEVISGNDRPFYHQRLHAIEPINQAAAITYSTNCGKALRIHCCVSARFPIGAGCIVLCTILDPPPLRTFLGLPRESRSCRIEN